MTQEARGPNSAGRPENLTDPWMVVVRDESGHRCDLSGTHGFERGLRDQLDTASCFRHDAIGIRSAQPPYCGPNEGRGSRLAGCASSAGTWLGAARAWPSKPL